MESVNLCSSRAPEANIKQDDHRIEMNWGNRILSPPLQWPGASKWKGWWLHGARCQMVRRAEGVVHRAKRLQTSPEKKRKACQAMAHFLFLQRALRGAPKPANQRRPPLHPPLITSRETSKRFKRFPSSVASLPSRLGTKATDRPVSYRLSSSTK